jgi:phosphoribosylanthranilate isomerase
MAKYQVPKIKYCGITRIQDVLHATSLGIDFIGLNFIETSKRYISLSIARDLLDHTAVQVTGSNKPEVVGIFCDPTHEFLNEVARILPEIGVYQLHGSETIDFVEKIQTSFPQKAVWKALGISSSGDIAAIQTYASADLILLDHKGSQAPETRGGTGKYFDWSLLKGLHAVKPLGVAGGINVTNIDDLRQYPLSLIDICSGIESSPGIKDHQLMTSICSKVRAWRS